MSESSDRWHRWLLDIRHGGDLKAREQDLTEYLYPVRDTVLDRARLRPDDTLLDVGAGDGLIAFGALERLGQAGQVIFSDISQELLDHCRKAAEAEGLQARCRFVLGAADSLMEIPDASVDVVTTRSVLIYVKDKAAALREFYRALRPGGRISLFEPINVLMGVYDPDRFWGYEIRPIAPLAAKVNALYESIQPPGEDPMVDFDERDLVRHAEQAGFPVVDLELQVTVKDTRRPIPWDRFLRMSGNPLIPPTGEALQRTLSRDEIAEFTAYLKPLVESGTGQERRAFAYLTATKPLRSSLCSTRAVRLMPCLRRRSYAFRMSDSPLSRQEIYAAAAAHDELGPEYSDAVVASFLEKVDKEIDTRVDARLAGMRQPAPPAERDDFRTLLKGAAIGIGASGIAFLVVGGNAIERQHRVILVLLLLAVICAIAAGWAGRPLGDRRAVPGPADQREQGAIQR